MKWEMMEYWQDGIIGYEFNSQHFIIPLFQYSNKLLILHLGCGN